MRNSIKYLWGIFKKYKVKMIIYFLFFEVSNRLVEIFILPYLLQILGNSFQSGTLTVQKSLIIVSMYSILFCYKYVFDIAFWKYIVYDFNFKVETDFKLNIFSYAVKHSMNYYNNKMSGTIASKIDNVTSQIADETLDEFFGIVSGLIIFIISVVVYSRINAYLMIFLVIWSVLFCLAQYPTSNFTYKAISKLASKNSEISGQIIDSFVNISNVKSFSRQRNERLIVKKQNVDILKLVSNVMVAKTISNIVMFLFMISLFVFVLGFSLKLLYDGKILIGTFLFIGQNITLMSFMLRTIYKNSVDFIQHISEINEGLRMVLQPIEIKDRENAGKLEVDEGRIVFKGVSFGYSKKNK